jgi:phenylalanyl-tRNA synthetase beta chain
VLGVSEVPFEVRAAQHEPWHPGRCGALYLESGQLAGYAGELHPRVVQAFALPPRTCAAELDLSLIEAAAAARGPVLARPVSGYPVATQDVALVVPADVPAADVEAALVAGVTDAGEGGPCGCSTSTPASRRGREASRWLTRCGSGHRTGH